VRLSPQAGYLSSSIYLNQHSIFENPNIGFIVVRRLDAKGGTTLSLTTLAAPEKALKSYTKAREELSKEKPNLKKAKGELQKATKAYPEYAEAWHLLGKTGIRMQDEDLARSSFANSFAADPKFTPPYFELIYIEMQGSRFGEAALLSNILLDLLPDAPRAQYLHGLAYYKLGDLAVAEQSFRRIEKSGNWKEFTMTFFFLGMIDAKQGEIPLAAKEFRTYLRVTPEQLFPESLKDQLIKQLQTWERGGLIEAETPLPENQN
jgi:tetratricopeptide (TPR) repeat protein